jgi:undecaprenyl-diphosphatase
MSYLESIIIAIVEGLTEFLPVSSTGHMIITSSLMGIADDPFTKTFTVAIQLGAILSVVVLYFRRFFRDLRFYAVLFVGFLPSALIGLALDRYIDHLLSRVDVVGWALILGGLFFLSVDRIFQKNEAHADTEVTHRTALWIGFFQCLALVPGVSRSAASILGGLSRGLNRKTAAEFSFFLAVPTMAAATGYKLLTYSNGGVGFTGREIGLLLTGNAVAFVVAMIAIKSFISFLSTHGFRWFGYYRIMAGGALLTLYYLGVELSIL